MNKESLLSGKSSFTRTNVFDCTVKQLQRMIDDGKFSPGDKLPSERELVEQLSISRSVVREALRVLEAQGLVAILQGKGVYVQRPGLQTVLQPVQRLLKDGSITLRDLMQARYLLEPEIVKIASKQVKDEQLKGLEQHYHEMIKYLDYPEKYLEADKNFHSLLVACTGNPVLVIMMCPVITMFNGFIELFYQVPGTPQKVFTAHDKILNALRTHDAQSAETAMRSHLQEVVEWFGPTFASEKIFSFL
jgi:GntR family transcriptional repressor for pyruvate dehydrogenase complex